VTNDSIHTYTWDAFGNATTIDGIGIIYDAFDRMVEQQRPGNNNAEIIYSPTGFKMQIMNGAASNFSFVPLPGGTTVVYVPGSSYYRHADWLGSSRFATITPGRTVLYDGAYAPFGEPYAQSGTPDYSFTGMNTDTSAGLYDFLYREYSTQGRWPQPDPAGIGAIDTSNPQSWNRYAYVFNNPLALVDPPRSLRRTG
jgi:RHS repeat-associated protein